MTLSWTILLFGAVANVGLIEWVKDFPAVKKLKPYYHWLPLVGAVIVGLATSSLSAGGFALAAWAVHAVCILAISVLGYKNIVEFVQKRLRTFKTK